MGDTWAKLPTTFKTRQKWRMLDVRRSSVKAKQILTSASQWIIFDLVLPTSNSCAAQWVELTNFKLQCFQLSFVIFYVRNQGASIKDVEDDRARHKQSISDQSWLVCSLLLFLNQMFRQGLRWVFLLNIRCCLPWCNTSSMCFGGWCSVFPMLFEWNWPWSGRKHVAKSRFVQKTFDCAPKQPWSNCKPWSIVRAHAQWSPHIPNYSLPTTTSFSCVLTKCAASAAQKSIVRSQAEAVIAAFFR